MQRPPSPATRGLPDVDPFAPLVPTPRRWVMLRVLIGPLLWLIALVVVAVVVHRTDAILFGALIASGSLVFFLVGLAMLRARRNRLRRRYDDRR